MSRIYTNPPIIEALCEFRFRDGEWDWTIPGLLYQQIKDEFPQKREQRQVELELQAEPGAVSQRVLGAPGRMQFLRADEKALVQVGPQLLVVNHLAPYSSWNDFGRLVFRMLSVYSEIAAPKGFERIGLRYINRIRVPDGLEFSDCFHYRPALPEGLSSPLRSILMRVAFDYVDDAGAMLLTLASAPDVAESAATFILDLDFYTMAAGDLDLDSARTWIEAAHDRIETVFEASITDALRSSFGEVA